MNSEASSVNPALVLVGLVIYGALAFGWRSWLQWRRTGSTGFRGLSGGVGSAEWIGGALLVVAFILAFAAPVVALAGSTGAWQVSLAWRAALTGVGAALFGAGLVGTIAAQLSMGDSWRIGVDDTERTALVSRGLFRVARNPIFTSMIALLAGLALLVPGVVALAAFASALIGLEIQVRLVEEPYLLRAHGDAYARYASRVGRFVPWLGCLRAR